MAVNVPCYGLLPRPKMGGGFDYSNHDWCQRPSTKQVFLNVSNPQGTSYWVAGIDLCDRCFGNIVFGDLKATIRSVGGSVR